MSYLLPPFYLLASVSAHQHNTQAALLKGPTGWWLSVCGASVVPPTPLSKLMLLHEYWISAQTTPSRDVADMSPAQEAVLCLALRFFFSSFPCVFTRQSFPNLDCWCVFWCDSSTLQRKRPKAKSVIGRRSLGVTKLCCECLSLSLSPVLSVCEMNKYDLGSPVKGAD